MIPVKDYVIVDFLEWIKENHPEIKSLREIPEEKLLDLCREFTQKGFIAPIDKILKDFSKWLYTREKYLHYEDIHYLSELFHVFLHEHEDKYKNYTLNSIREINEEVLFNSLRDFLSARLYKNLATKLKEENYSLFLLVSVSEQTEIIKFIDWLSQKHPEIDLLANIPDQELKNLIREFKEEYKEYRMFTNSDVESLFEQLLKIKKGKYYQEVFEKLLNRNIQEKKRNRSYIESVDPLKRYKTVPLHAIFLYSSQHSYIENYIIKHWGALSSMSGDYCDIYFSLDQLDRESDAFDIIDHIKEIKDNIDISKLPGILFWGKDISNNYFLSLKDFDEKNITDMLLTIFQQIRKSQDIESIRTGELLFKGTLKKDISAATTYITINIEKVMGDVIAGDLNIQNINIQLLSDIFKSLEWNEENEKRIMQIEKSLRDNKKTIDDIYSLVQNLVKENAHDESFLIKLKNFAISTLNNIPSSIFANAICSALLNI